MMDEELIAYEREAYLAKQRAYYEENREAVAAKHRAYREENREAIAAKQRLIRDVRLCHGYAQRELADLCGVDTSTICSWETGRHPAKWELLFSVMPDLEERTVIWEQENMSCASGTR